MARRRRRRRNRFHDLGRPVVNAQDWLTRLAAAMRPVFYDAGYPIPNRINVTVGKTGRRDWQGEAHSCHDTRDGTCNVFISPYVVDPYLIGDILMHELVHVVVGVEYQHGSAFKTCARRIGLTGKITTTVAGPELKARLRSIIDGLGPYPYSPLIPPPPRSVGVTKTRTVRTVKCYCPGCKGVIRVSARIAENHPPLCGNDECERYGEPMLLDSQNRVGAEE